MAQQIATIRTGDTTPSNTIGVDGDVYINTSTNEVYTKVAGSYVISVGNTVTSTANLFNYYNFI